MCDRWRHSFEAFYADMGERPEGLTIDRWDNDGPYSPENCKWSTWNEQARNRRSSRFLKIGELAKTPAEWEEISGVKSVTIRYRIDVLGWDVKKAITTSVIGRGRRPNGI